MTDLVDRGVKENNTGPFVNERRIETELSSHRDTRRYLMGAEAREIAQGRNDGPRRQECQGESHWVVCDRATYFETELSSHKVTRRTPGT